MLNSSSEIQWTVMVSWEAVQSSSRIDGGLGAVTKGGKEGKENILSVMAFYNVLLLLTNPTFPGKEVFLKRSFRLHIPHNLKSSAETSSSPNHFCFNDIGILGKDLSLSYSVDPLSTQPALTHT